MSKNKQMLSEKIIIVGSERATAGPVGLAQGVYGARGNLELVACDAHDGLWVFWFNADHEDHEFVLPGDEWGEHWCTEIDTAADLVVSHGGSSIPGNGGRAGRVERTIAV